MPLCIVATDLNRIAFNIDHHNTDKVKRAILMLGAFESWQYCKRYTQFWFLIIGDLNLDMPLCIVATDLNRIAFNIDHHNTDKVETGHFDAWLIRIVAILQEIYSVLIPDHWGLKLGHAVMHCSDRFEQNRFQHRSPQYDKVETGHFDAWRIRIVAILQEIYSVFDSWSLGT